MAACCLGEELTFLVKGRPLGGRGSSEQSNSKLSWDLGASVLHAWDAGVPLYASPVCSPSLSSVTLPSSSPPMSSLF